VAARACDERWLEIEVRDNGMGIDHALLPRIFDLFTQDERTLDRSEGGLGIGLAVVKRLTELHGGSARVDSAGPGKGATFTVRLPRADRREQPRGAPPQAARAPVKPLSMLVVDDNRDAADSLATLLRLDGHRVDVAHDGEQALAAARSMMPAVVMLDLELPKIDGISVARQLRADPRLRQSVVIATSGYARDSDRHATADAGFDAHLVKPVDLPELYRVIDVRLKAGGAP
jgi:CheY-like chemotaxis protein